MFAMKIAIGNLSLLGKPKGLCLKTLPNKNSSVGTTIRSQKKNMQNRNLLDGFHDFMIFINICGVYFPSIE
jgi:hypothetical protein